MQILKLKISLLRSSPGIWDIEGCHLVESNLTHTQCECNHLTSFAILVNHQNFQQSRTHTVILDFLTWVGLTTSLICLAFSIVTFIYFKLVGSNSILPAIILYFNISTGAARWEGVYQEDVPPFFK